MPCLKKATSSFQILNSNTVFSEVKKADIWNSFTKNDLHKSGVRLLSPSEYLLSNYNYIWPYK